MAALKKWVDDVSGTVTTGGSSTAYTITTNSVFSTAALMSGALICFIPHATSGASPTLAVDGLTARAINKSTGVAVPTGGLIIGTPYLVTYIHASTEFILVGALGVAVLATDNVVTSNITDNAVTYGKIQKVSSVSLIGNSDSVSSVAPSAMTVGKGLMLASSTLTVSSTAPIYQIFTSGTSSTYTVTDSVRISYLEVRAVAGGGGGGGGGATGSTGGTTTFGGVSAIGGTGGGAHSGAATYGTGGAGGTGGTGTATLRVAGEAGAAGNGCTAAFGGTGGQGGPAPFFGGGGTQNNNAATNTGGGGGGLSGGAGQAGDGGGGSGEYFEWIISNVSSTYTYTVGGGGLGGTSAGSGAAGRIIVKEFYH